MDPVDDEPAVLSAVARDLRARYGGEYRIVHGGDAKDASGATTLGGRSVTEAVDEHPHRHEGDLEGDEEAEEEPALRARVELEPGEAGHLDVEEDEVGLDREALGHDALGVVDDAVERAVRQRDHPHLVEAAGGSTDVILIATCSEVQLALHAQAALAQDGIAQWDGLR